MHYERKSNKRIRESKININDIEDTTENSVSENYEKEIFEEPEMLIDEKGTTEITEADIDKYYGEQ
jgi:hypothetical protein